MTIVVSWVRRRADAQEELWCVTDSRIRSGGTLDCCPKVLALPRDDSLVAFAGDTYYAYPLMIQLVQAIETYAPMLARAIDYPKLRAHALNVFNSMANSFRAEVSELETPRTQFLLAGYSWRKKEFEIDAISYSAGLRSFFFYAFISRNWPIRSHHASRRCRRPSPQRSDSAAP